MTLPLSVAVGHAYNPRSDRPMPDCAPSCVVHKFGGTSLADARCFRQVAKIVNSLAEDRRLIVVSAMAGVTDQLVRAVHVAGKRDLTYREIIASVGARHRQTITELLPAE